MPMKYVAIVTGQRKIASIMILLFVSSSYCFLIDCERNPRASTFYFYGYLLSVSPGAEP